MKRWLISLATMVLAAMLIMALPAVAADPQGELEQATVPVADNPSEMLGVFKTMDDQLMDVAHIVPGFGGMYIDESEEVLYVYSVGRSDAAALRRAVATVFGPETVPTGGVRVIPGSYTIPQLFRWYRLINQHVFSLPGVSATDLQEAGNHLWIGINDESVRVQVEGEVDRLGIPGDAAVIEVSGPVIAESHTLRSPVRPVDAGVQIDNEYTTIVGDCTYGFTALRNNSTLGMVTNSHCTRTMGIVDLDRFHQPSMSGTTNLVGTELFDPAFFTNTQDSRCPTGKSCRYSDSAFVPSSGNLTLNRGYIAYPTSLTTDVNNPDLTIGHNMPRLRITAIGSPVVGNWVHKVGRSTGWTLGLVSATCVNVTNTSGYVFICQNKASYLSAGGDSGSPVFTTINGSGDVKLFGIHWGGADANGNRTFSPLGGVWSELAPGGTFQVCDPNFGC